MAGKIVAGVAVWAAVSGCVAVEPGAAPAPPSPSGRPAQVVEPQIVQGPAREVLEAVLPDGPAAAPPAPKSPRATARTAPGNAPRERSEMGVPPAEGWGRAVPQQPRPPRPPRTRAMKPPALPSLPPVPVVRPDVCALGEDYGQWRPDSPEARICRKT